MKREEPIAESDCREGRVHKMMTSIRKTVSFDRNDIATGSDGAARSVALNPRPVAIAMTLLAAIAVGMMLMLPGSPLHAQDSTIEYAENGTDPVATFTADDPEGDTVTWTVTGGTDQTAFGIGENNGVLEFNAPPDYEGGATTGGGDANNDNTYEVIVTATDSATPAETETYTLNVKVTNLEETGKVTWGVDHDADNTADTPTLVQFQVGAILSVAATGGVLDGDVQGTDKDVAERLQWSRASSKAGPWTAIPNQTGATYTVMTDDIGMYLRVDVFYNVGGGREESASRMSDYPVLGTRSSNDAPEFSPATIAREISEGDKGRNVGAPVSATDDITNALNYTLADADSGDNEKFEIDQKTGQIKTLWDLNRDVTTEATATAAGNCATENACVVTVVATDSAGAASDAATVNIKLTDVNEKPTFDATGNPTAITRAENTTALADTDADVTYAATDPEGLNVNLTLVGPDAAKFSLSTGGVLSFGTAPDYEMPTDANKDNVYMVTVRASDGVLDADRMVAVTVTDANDAPDVSGPSSVNYVENGKGPVATFTADDPDDDTITWSVAGTGTEDFEIDAEDGVLEFLSSPDYENPTGGDTNDSNTYVATVTATDDGTGTLTDTFTVTVKVTAVAETGKVTWTTDANADGTADDPTLVQFQVGSLLTATAEDGDIPGTTQAFTTDITGVAGVSWRWYRGNTRITDSDANDNTYTVTTEDVGNRIRATVFYTVGTGREESASLTSDYPVLGTRSSNDAPVFSPPTITREISEGDKGRNVGAPVRATDDITNALNYTLSGTGADNAKFEIDQKTGQIKTLFDLNRDVTTEATATAAGNCATENACVVTVVATDSAGAASDAATVNIKLTDVNEKPSFGATGNPTAITRAENTPALADTDADVTYTAEDPEGRGLTYVLMGPDAAKFQLSATRVLSFRTAPDYEMPADANSDNIYEVTVRASDGVLYADRMVRVTVTGVNEAPEIMAGGLVVSGPASANYAENGTDAVATYTARGANAASARWTLEGADAGDFTITGGALTFQTAPDFESPADADGDNEYMVTVKATAGDDMDTQDVTVTVTNVAEGPAFPSATDTRSVAENTAAGENIGAPVEATADTGTTIDSYALGGTDAASFDIDSATGQLMTKAALDHETKDSYSVTVTATDSAGLTDTIAVTINVTDVDEEANPLLERYDADNSGEIERDEVISAINDYLFGEGEDAIGRAEVIEVINLFLFGE